jgi:phytoene/squalene synthetase
MESLKKFRAKRTNINGQITQFVNFVKDYGEDRKEQLPDRLKRAGDLYNMYMKSSHR